MSIKTPLEMPLPEDVALELYSHYRYTIEGMANTIKILRRAIRDYRRIYRIRNICRVEEERDKLMDLTEKFIGTIGDKHGWFDDEAESLKCVKDYISELKRRKKIRKELTTEERYRHTGVPLSYREF